jgi:ATP-dependent Clp protease ATP-binding subunit ClpB
LHAAQSRAAKEGDSYVPEEWVVLSLFKDKQVAPCLTAAGVDERAVESFIQMQRQGKTVEEKNDEEMRNALEKYTQDLTELAEQGKLDPVIGRDEEIRRTGAGASAPHEK